ncbi:hypothetical protein AG1IA_05121 [Rhizoctonia solani AG-1 IA]|uniref:Uncharacterized protein n=1 Tax=Thanatephorus cucumeris (strain AG1-IA) TaxID=983506 RepID=L8WWY1_THACA|nr:hypothetical protein AG1IA_05121 [Rhizoctonia solani AG-1 IA]
MISFRRPWLDWLRRGPVPDPSMAKSHECGPCEVMSSKRDTAKWTHVRQVEFVQITSTITWTPCSSRTDLANVIFIHMYNHLTNQVSCQMRKIGCTELDLVTLAPHSLSRWLRF